MSRPRAGAREVQRWAWWVKLVIPDPNEEAEESGVQRQLQLHRRAWAHEFLLITAQIINLKKASRLF